MGAQFTSGDRSQKRFLPHKSRDLQKIRAREKRTTGKGGPNRRDDLLRERAKCGKGTEETGLIGLINMREGSQILTLFPPGGWEGKESKKDEGSAPSKKIFSLAWENRVEMRRLAPTAKTYLEKRYLRVGKGGGRIRKGKSSFRKVVGGEDAYQKGRGHQKKVRKSVRSMPTGRTSIP